MCGIIGFLGTIDGFDHAINGLEQLQNRGYDSSGYCGITNNQLECVKYTSTKSEPAVQKIKKERNSFNTMIAHNRWKTHGSANDINAHPHIDYKNRIALVHNGIIENYFELKTELEEKGISFRSQTDSEVIVNLISYYYDQTCDSQGVKHMEEAIMKAMDRLEGTWALVIISIDKPDNLYCARHGSPLLIGFGNQFIMVASEQAGFCNNVSNYLCLDNNDVTVIRRRNNKVKFENLKNYLLRPITTKNNELTPDPYPYWTIKEINEQYDSAIRAISFGGRLLDDNCVRLGGPEQHIDELKGIDHLILLGCGTSYHSAKHSVHYFHDLGNFITVQAIDATEFTTSLIPRNGNTAVIFISQSGESRDLHRCIQMVRDKQCFTIGVVNVVDSQIARDVDCGCYLNSGREVGVASTKAFTNQVIVLSMLAIFFAQIHNINNEKRKFYIKNLRQLPIQILATIQNSEENSKKIADFLFTQQQCFILGKGQMVSIAEEGALKIKEIGYLNTQGMPLLMMRHGCYAIIEQDTPVIFINPNDSNYIFVNNTIEEVVSRDGLSISISDTEDVSKHAKHKIVVPENEIYKGILHVIPLQLIAYYLAVKKGHNPDIPKGLSKTLSV